MALEPTRARFDGECPLCEEPIREGVDDIVKFPTDEEWVHAQCAADFGESVEGYMVDSHEGTLE